MILIIIGLASSTREFADNFISLQGHGGGGKNKKYINTEIS
jgi:hypothetical protein